MAKEKKGSGIQQAAGLIRYFDEESEDAIQISKGSVYFVCVVFSIVVYLANEPTPDNNVWKWMWKLWDSSSTGVPSPSHPVPNSDLLSLWRSRPCSVPFYCGAFLSARASLALSRSSSAESSISSPDWSIPLIL